MMRLLSLAALAAASLAMVVPASAGAVRFAIYKGSMPIEFFGISQAIDSQLAELIARGARLDESIETIVQSIEDRRPPRTVFSDGNPGKITIDNVFTAYAGSGYITIENYSNGEYVTRISTDDEIRYFQAEENAGAEVSAVPEAGTWAMMLTGLGLVAGAARYHRRRAKTVIA